MKIKNWYELRGYVENCITRYLKEEDVTLNKMALFLGKNPCELRILCTYQDISIPNDLKLLMSVLSFMRFCGFSKKDFMSAYMQYRDSLENPPF